MTNEELHDRIDEFAREIMQTHEEWREELRERRVPPPRDGKYDGGIEGAVPVSDLRQNYG